MNGSKRLRGKSWELTITLGRDRNGKLIRKSKTIPPDPYTGKPIGAREADRELKNFADSFSRVSGVEFSRLTFSDYLDWWIEHVQEPNCEDTTVKWQKGIIETKIKPFLGHIRMDKLSTQDIQEFYSYQLKQGMIVRGKETDKPVSLRTVQGYKKILNAALNYAADELKCIPDNPAKGARLEVPRKRKYITLDEEDAIKFIMEAREDRNFTMYVFDILVGLRKSEFLALRWPDLDLVNGVGEVSQVITQYGKNYKFSTKGKTEESLREFPIPAVLCRLLERHKLRQNEERMKAGPAWHKGADGKPLDLVFCYADGRPINGKSILRNAERKDGKFKLNRSVHGCSYRMILKRAGLSEEIRIHDLRHSFATLLMSEGENQALIGSMLGHADGSLVTEMYTHSNMKMKKRAAERLANKILPDDLIRSL